MSGKATPKSGTKIPKPKSPAKKTKSGTNTKKAKGPCPYECQQVPLNVPEPDTATRCMHPKKDVFVVKVSKVNASGNRRIKMELELVTPKAKDRRPPWRIDSRETQFDRPCSPCRSPCNSCCHRLRSKKPKVKKNKSSPQTTHK